MKFEPLLCCACGGPLELNGTSTSVCRYCNVTNVVSGNIINYVDKLNSANQYRQKCEFDTANALYDIILQETQPTIDVLWNKTLCFYGIEYVKSPDSEDFKPTLHRIEDIDIFENETFTEALSLADSEQKEVLIKAAKEISDIQKEFMNVVKNEPPYDVFICYKETDENNNQTKDSIRGRELYELLTQKGLNVFFSRITLQGKLGIQYEPYIFAALKSSGVMVLMASEEKYINSVWVKNEWSRYLQLKKEDSKKSFFIACENPSSLPKYFRQYQVQKLTESDALHNLTKNILDYFENQKHKINHFVDLESLYKAALELNKQKRYGESYDKLKEIIQRNPSSCDAYWLKLCNFLQTPLEEMEDGIIDFRTENDYITAVSLANDEKKAEYERIAMVCVENEKAFHEFEATRKQIIEDYKQKKRGSSKLEEVRQKEKKVLRETEATLVFNSEHGSSFAKAGIIITIISGILTIPCFLLYKVEVNTAFYLAFFLALINWFGLMMLSGYLRKWWSASICFFGLNLDLGMSVVAMEEKSFSIVCGLVLLFSHVIVFIFLLIGRRRFLLRDSKAIEKKKEYDIVFREYADGIVSDIADALELIIRKREHNLCVPSAQIRTIRKNNYQEIGQDIISLLEEVYIYDNPKEVFM